MAGHGVESVSDFYEEMRQLVGEYKDSWWSDAACKGLDSDLFFPERGHTSRKAKQVCSGCPVRAECLAYALELNERFGTWGNKTDRERWKIRKNLQEDT